MRQNFHDAALVAKPLVAAVRHPQEVFTSALGREVHPKIGSLFGRWLLVEPDVAISELMLQHEIHQLLL